MIEFNGQDSLAFDEVMEVLKRYPDFDYVQMNDDSCCYPSIGTVARELQLSRRTVERAIDDLVRAGLITKTVLAGEQWAEQPAFYSERPLNLKKEMPPRGKCALLAA